MALETILLQLVWCWASKIPRLTGLLPRTCSLYLQFSWHVTPKMDSSVLWGMLLTCLFFSKPSASLRAKQAPENERGARERKIRSIFFFPHHRPLALTVNESRAVYILSPALDGLWKENRGSVKRLAISWIKAFLRKIISLHFTDISTDYKSHYFP